VEQTSDATRILSLMAAGDRAAADRLLPIVYEELRALAAGFMRHERPDHTLQPTALVHEAYLRLIDQSRTDWKNRAHFRAVASQMIRRILVDHAREHATARRGGGRARVAADPAAPCHGDGADLLALEEALEELGGLNDRQRRVVELRFFGGLSMKEAAHVLDVSPETIKTDWRFARAWLQQRLRG
jgi:RNA polymerase sigma factor (TIGR02999 family)